MASAARRGMLNFPMTFTLTTRMKRCRSCGASLPSVRSASAMPAQLTSTWSPPNSFSASATARQLLARLDLQVCDHHLGAVLGRHARGGSAEARGAAGHQEYAALDLHERP